MSANRLNCPPAHSRSGRTLLPPAESATALCLGEPAKLLVEASDWATAQALFGRVQKPEEKAAPTLIQLSPGLFFVRAQACGRYWAFDLPVLVHCE